MSTTKLKAVETKQCMACRAWNDPEEDRCGRCGRRLHLAAPVAAPAAMPPAPLAEAELQPALFREPIQVGARVIPMMAPLHSPAMQGAGEDEAKKTARRQHSRASRRPLLNQQVLAFPDAAAPFAPPEESIVCDAPVAAPVHRMVAAAVDSSLVLLAAGFFFAAFFAVGTIDLNVHAVQILAAVIAVLGLFYRAVWCIADADTPGMRFAGLRLVDFDGRRPDRHKRSVRQLTSVLSLVSAGLGLIWALVDEESLTWHDRISKTFPTAN